MVATEMYASTGPYLCTSNHNTFCIFLATHEEEGFAYTCQPMYIPVNTAHTHAHTQGISLYTEQRRMLFPLTV